MPPRLRSNAQGSGRRERPRVLRARTRQPGRPRPPHRAKCSGTLDRHGGRDRASGDAAHRWPPRVRLGMARSGDPAAGGAGVPQIDLDDGAIRQSSISRTAEATRGRSIQWNDWAKLMTRKVPRDPGRSSARIRIQLALVMCSSAPCALGLSQHSRIGVESNDALEEMGEEQGDACLDHNRRRGGARDPRGGGARRGHRAEPGHTDCDPAGSRRRYPRRRSRPRPSLPIGGCVWPSAMHSVWQTLHGDGLPRPSLPSVRSPEPPRPTSPRHPGDSPSRS